MSRNLDTLIAEVISRRVRLIPGTTIRFVPERNTLYELFFILRCLSLSTVGCRKDLIERIQVRGVPYNEVFPNEKTYSNGTSRINSVMPDESEQPGDRLVIINTIVEMLKEKSLSPKLEEVKVFERYGYYFDGTLKAYIHLRTGEMLGRCETFIDIMYIKCFNPGWKETCFTDDSSFHRPLKAGKIKLD